ncbi:MAG: type II toxin-antitoxin system RelE family toxin [Roseiflexaceae bacterium]
MPSYILDMTEDANEDLSHYRAFERKTITDEMAVQLVNEPDVETNSRRRLRDNPIARWELKVGKFRAFYEIDADAQIVTVISVGHKEHNVLYIRGKVAHL